MVSDTVDNAYVIRKSMPLSTAYPSRDTLRDQYFPMFISHISESSVHDWSVLVNGLPRDFQPPKVPCIRSMRGMLDTGK